MRAPRPARFLLAAVLGLAAAGWVPARAASPALAVTAPEAIVIDGWSGAVLYSRNATVLRAPASTVKVMTALIVLKSGIPMHRVVTVSPYDVSYGGSTAGLYAGETLTVWNLLHGMLLPSGNDAAAALAEAVSGSVTRFVARMNREARRLHLWHTRFLTPNGFDTPGQVTTARDLAFLARAAMNVPRFVRVVRTRYWGAWSADHRIYHRWSNLNKLLWASRSVDGVKTGTTPAAGACLIASAQRDGKWVIAVNMGSTTATRFSDGAALLNFGLGAEGEPPSA